MKIVKYHQSCLLIDTNGIRLLVDPGDIGYEDNMLEEWNNIDAILITHRHNDHCNSEAINKIVERDNCKVYITNEINRYHNLKNTVIVKENDEFNISDNVKIEVTHAKHGYLVGMRENDAEILENVGYIIDDGENRLYTTSDTINFYNEYRCDILCMPFNGNGLTLGVIDGTDFAKKINPKLVLPIHTEHAKPFMNPNIEELKSMLEEKGLNYRILDIKESIEIQ